VTTVLQRHINTITIAEHWDKKQRYKTGNAEMIDYEMAGRAI